MVNEKYVPDRGGKWGVTKEEFPYLNVSYNFVFMCDRYNEGPPFMNGFFYIISSDYVKAIAEKANDRSWPKLWLEDVNVGILLNEHNGKPVVFEGLAYKFVCKEVSLLL